MSDKSKTFTPLADLPNIGISFVANIIRLPLTVETSTFVSSCIDIAAIIPPYLTFKNLEPSVFLFASVLISLNFTFLAYPLLVIIIRNTASLLNAIASISSSFSFNLIPLDPLVLMLANKFILSTSKDIYLPHLVNIEIMSLSFANTIFLILSFSSRLDMYLPDLFIF